MKILIPIEMGKENIPKECINGFPATVEIIRFYHVGKIDPKKLRKTFKKSGAKYFFTSKPRKVINLEVMKVVKYFCNYSIFWYLEGISTYNRELNELNYLTLFNEGFSLSYDVCRLLRKKGVSCNFLPCAISSQLLDIKLNNKVKNKRDKIGFVGFAKGVRISYIKKLISLGFPIEVVGPNWHKYIDEKYIYANYLNSHEYIHYYHSLKIILNIDEWYPESSSGLGLRIFEIMSSNSLCLTNPIDELEECFGFIPNNILIWKDFNHLITLLKDELGKNGNSYNLHDILIQHTYKKRMKMIYNQFLLGNKK